MGRRRGAERDRDSPSGWIVGLATVCVAVPAVVAAVRAIGWGWVPASDQGTIATRAADVLTARSPRLGQLSGASAEVGLPTRSLGPMGYWPFAVTARWGPLWGSAVVAAGLSGASMVASVRLAARRGGPALAVATAVGLVLTARAVNPANLASTWNPAVGVMPLVLLVFLAWSIGVGEVWLLPVAVVVLSFCAQAHTALAVASLPVLAIGVVAGVGPSARRWIADRRARRRWRPGPTVPALLGAGAAGALCWALPLLDQATGDPGNMTRLSRARADELFPWAGTGRVVYDVIGIVPAFLRGDPSPSDQTFGVLLGRATLLDALSSAVVVLALVVLVGRGLVTRQRERVVPPLLVLALVGAAALVARGTPGPSFLVLTYTMWWAVPVGMLAWVVIAREVGRAAGWGAVAARALAGRRGVVVAAVVCAGAVAVAVASPARPEPEEPIHDAARVAGDAVAAVVEPGRLYLVSGQGTAGEQLVASTAYRVRRAGAVPVVVGNDGVAVGPRHVPQGRRCAAVVTAVSGTDPPAGATVVVELRLPARDGSTTGVAVAVGPDDDRPSC